MEAGINSRRSSSEDAYEDAQQRGRGNISPARAGGGAVSAAAFASLRVPKITTTTAAATPAAAGGGSNNNNNNQNNNAANRTRSTRLFSDTEAMGGTGGGGGGGDMAAALVSTRILDAAGSSGEDARLRLARERISQLESRSAAARMEQTGDRQQVAELKGELHQARAEIVQLKEQLRDSQKDARARANVQQEQMQRLFAEQQSRSIADWEKKLADARRTTDELKVELETTKTSQRRTEAERADIQKTADQLKRRLAETESEKAKLDEQLRVSALRVVELERDVSTLKQQLGQAEQLSKDLQSKSINAAQATFLQERLTRAESRATEAEQRTFELEKELREVHSGRHTHLAKDADVQNQLELAERRAQAMEDQMDEMREAHKKKVQQLQLKLDQQHTQHLDTIQQHQQQLQAQQQKPHQHAQSEEEIATQAAAMRALRDRLERAQETNRSLERELHAAESEKIEWQDKARGLEVRALAAERSVAEARRSNNSSTGGGNGGESATANKRENRVRWSDDRDDTTENNNNNKSQNHTNNNNHNNNNNNFSDLRRGPDGVASQQQPQQQQPQPQPQSQQPQSSQDAVVLEYQLQQISRLHEQLRVTTETSQARVAELEAELTVNKGMLTKALLALQPLEIRTEMAEQQLLELKSRTEGSEELATATQDLAAALQVERGEVQRLRRMMQTGDAPEMRRWIEELQQSMNKYKELYEDTLRKHTALSEEVVLLKQQQRGRNTNEIADTDVTAEEAYAIHRTLAGASQDLRLANERIHMLEARLARCEHNASGGGGSGLGHSLRPSEDALTEELRQQQANCRELMQRIMEVEALREMERRRADEREEDLQRRILELESTLPADIERVAKAEERIGYLEQRLQEAYANPGDEARRERDLVRDRRIRDLSALNDELTAQLAAMRQRAQQSETQRSRIDTDTTIMSLATHPELTREREAAVQLERERLVALALSLQQSSSRSEREGALVRVVEELDAALRRSEAKNRPPERNEDERLLQEVSYLRDQLQASRASAASDSSRKDNEQSRAVLQCALDNAEQRLECLRVAGSSVLLVALCSALMQVSRSHLTTQSAPLVDLVPSLEAQWSHFASSSVTITDMQREFEHASTHAHLLQRVSVTLAPSVAAVAAARAAENRTATTSSPWTRAGGTTTHTSIRSTSPFRDPTSIRRWG